MDYNYFIGMVENNETDRIRAYVGENITSPERIPDAFALLLPQIIQILEDKIDSLCEPDDGMVIFGLQPASSMIISNKPMIMQRYIADLQPDYHFCCTLDYFVVAKDKLAENNHWQHTESLIIDFTSGEIMDVDRYTTRLFGKPEQGNVLGKLNSHALAVAWAVVKLKQSRQVNRAAVADLQAIVESDAEVAKTASA